MLLIRKVRGRTPRIVIQNVDDIITAPARRQRITFRLTRTRERNAALDARRLCGDAQLVFKLLIGISLCLSKRSPVGLPQLSIPVKKVRLKLIPLRRSLFRGKDISNFIRNRMQRKVCRISATRPLTGGIAHSKALCVIVTHDCRKILIAELIISRADISCWSRTNARVKLTGEMIEQTHTGFFWKGIRERILARPLTLLKVAGVISSLDVCSYVSEWSAL